MVQGVDVSDRCICVSVHIPGNVLAGNWKAAVLVDDRCSEEQQAALLNVFTGQLGGAVADLAALIGEVVAVERVPITFDVVEGKGHISDRGRGGGAAGALPGLQRDADLVARLGVLHHPRLARLRRARPRRCPPRRQPAWPARRRGARARTPYRARSGSRPEPMTATVHGSRARRDPALALGGGGGLLGCCWSGWRWRSLGSRTTTACSGRSLGQRPGPRARGVRRRLAGDGRRR